MVLSESGCCYQNFLSSVRQVFITGFLQDFWEIFIFFFMQIIYLTPMPLCLGVYPWGNLAR